MKRAYIISILLCFMLSQMEAQEPTVGLLEINQSLISDGYTLICPWLSKDFYLINNCGEVVHKWETDLAFDLKMCYLDDEGNFLILNNDVVTKYDWDNNKVWELSSKDFGLIAHHDFEIMPNGNILVIASEQLSFEESLALGFESINTDSSQVIIDGLYEFKHIENDSFKLEWKWNFKDHLVQETNDTVDNYGIVENEARKLNINFTNQADVFDWLHCNGVNYNESLDQVIISSRNTSEIYIIDHSTSIEEAASSTGGNQDHGGDFLWRWGVDNLTEQHDPNWIPEDHPFGGMISVFNNIDSSGMDFFSSIKIIDPPVDAQGKYLIDTLNQFLPKEAVKILSGEEHQIFSPFMSGAHSQANGNFIICSGRFGIYYELTEDGQLAWKYQSPLLNEPLPQYTTAQASFTFNIRKYPLDFIGFQGKNLTPNGLIENENPVSQNCIQNTNVENLINNNLSVFPNPSNGQVKYESDLQVEQIQIFALSGKKIKEINNPRLLNDHTFQKGNYILQFKLENGVINKMISIIP